MTISTASVSTTAGSVYTSLGNTAITFLSICNYTAGNVSVNVYAVPFSNSAANTNIIMTGIELEAAGNGTGDTYQLYSGGEKLLLSNGDSIQMTATANSAVTVVTSYTTI
jgi:hypothetical protein